MICHICLLYLVMGLGWLGTDLLRPMPGQERFLVAHGRPRAATTPRFDCTKSLEAKKPAAFAVQASLV